MKTIAIVSSFVFTTVNVCAQYNPLDFPAIKSSSLDYISASDQFTFDFGVTYTTETSRGVHDNFIFFNRQKGYLMHPQNPPGFGLVGKAWDLASSDFNAILISLRGQQFAYFNKREGNGRPRIRGTREALKKYVTTGNTDMDNYIIPASNTVLRKIGTKKTFAGYEGTLYYSSAKNVGFYLYGKSYPATITMKKYFGTAGLGYIKQDNLLYFILQMQTEEYKVYVNEIGAPLERTFNGAPYTIMEEKFAEESQESRQAIEEYRNDMANVSRDNPCKAEYDSWYREKIQNEQNLEAMLSNRANNQVSMADIQKQTNEIYAIDFTYFFRIKKLELLKDRCLDIAEREKYYAMRPDPRTNEARTAELARINRSMECKRIRIDQYARAEHEMRNLKINLGHDKKRYATEAMRLFFSLNVDLEKSNPCP